MRNPSALHVQARRRRPARITTVTSPVDKFNQPLTPVAVTGRTTAHGDRTGLKVPRPSMEIGTKTGADKTVLPVHSRSPETGRIAGARIGPCTACGHTRMISNVTRLCGVASCVKARQARFDRRALTKRGKRWEKRYDGTVVVL